MILSLLDLPNRIGTGVLQVRSAVDAGVVPRSPRAVGPDPDTAEFVGKDVVGYVPSGMLSDPGTWTPATF